MGKRTAAGMLPRGSGPIRVRRKTPVGAEPRERTENRKKYIAWLKPYLAAFPMSSANDVRRAGGAAGFDCGVYRELLIILGECGCTIRNGVVRMHEEATSKETQTNLPAMSPGRIRTD